MEEILEQITNKITMYATVLGAFADAQHLRLLKPGNERPEGNWHTREVNALKDVSRRLLNVYKESANNVEPRFAGEVQTVADHVYMIGHALEFSYSEYDMAYACYTISDDLSLCADELRRLATVNAAA